jgi:hypothetical protein
MGQIVGEIEGKDRKEVLTPSHKLWPDFRRELYETITTYVNHKPHTKCQGDLCQTVKLLNSLEDIDVEETVMLFKELGGYCDCEVLRNVARSWNNKQIGGGCDG